MFATYPSEAWGDEVAQTQLALSYVRRKRFEARLVATEVVSLLAGGSRRGGGNTREVKAVAMAARFGVMV